MIEIAREVNFKGVCYLRYGLQAVVIVTHHHKVCIFLEAVQEMKQSGKVFVEAPATKNIRSNSAKLLNSTCRFSTDSMLVLLGRIFNSFSFHCFQLVERMHRIGSVVKRVG